MTHIRTTSTSRNTASASPIVIRDGERTRLVFHPLIIGDNPRNPGALVNGTFTYERKRPSGEWEKVESINLSKLTAGEGVRLDLKSDEVNRLYCGLRDLYKIGAEFGVKPGTKDFIEADSKVKQLVDALTGASLTEAEDIELLGLFLNWLREQNPSNLAARVDPRRGVVADFNAALAAARLHSVLEEMRANQTNSSEDFWQELLKENSWVLSQVYADPLVIIDDQAYVGGKAIDNKGGKLTDFLLANAFTENAVVVEIKTPQTNLLQGRPYRPGLFAPHPDFTGAVAQAIHNRSILKENYRSIAGDENPELRPFHPRALLIVGTTSQLDSGEKRRSFEQYRHSFRDLEVLTFDELAQKVADLLVLLGSPGLSA